MSETGLAVFDRTVQTSMIMVNNLDEKLQWNNRENTFKALRIILHVLRDRVPPEEAIELGAQLPMMLSGFYYENYRLADVPTKERTKADFLGKVQSEFERVNLDADPECVVKAVFQTLVDHITPGEASDLAHNFPQALKDLWPEAVRA